MSVAVTAPSSDRGAHTPLGAFRAPGLRRPGPPAFAGTGARLSPWLLRVQGSWCVSRARLPVCLSGESPGPGRPMEDQRMPGPMLSQVWFGCGSVPARWGRALRSPGRHRSARDPSLAPSKRRGPQALRGSPWAPGEGQGRRSRRGGLDKELDRMWAQEPQRAALGVLFSGAEGDKDGFPARKGQDGSQIGDL